MDGTCSIHLKLFTKVWHNRSIQKQDAPFSWELLQHLTGIDPKEFTGDNAYRLSNGLLGDKDEKSLFNMLAWYLEPEVRISIHVEFLLQQKLILYILARLQQ